MVMEVIYLNLDELKCVSENIDLDEYIEFREYVKNSMEYPEWLGDFTKKDLVNMLNNGSKIWCYYLNDDLVCSMMLILPDKKSVFKFGLNLNYREVVDYGPMFVNPEYVGNGLQYQMLGRLDNYCERLGYKYAVCTAHPDNIYSINNLLKDGFKYNNKKEFVRGIRNIYLKELIPINKILAFLVNSDNEFLLLKGSDKAPKFHKSFWHVVTGSAEKEDKTLEDTVKREVMEETGLIINKMQSLNLVFEYNSLGSFCSEEAFISYVDNINVTLNEESIDYKWCSLYELIDMIKWYSSKDELKDILENALNQKFIKKVKKIKI